MLKLQTHVIPIPVALELSVLLKAFLDSPVSVLQAPLEIPKCLAPRESVKEMKIVLIKKPVKTTTVLILAKLELVKRTISVRLSDTYLHVEENLCHLNKR